MIRRISENTTRKKPDWYEICDTRWIRIGTLYKQMELFKKNGNPKIKTKQQLSANFVAREFLNKFTYAYNSTLNKSKCSQSSSKRSKLSRTNQRQAPGTDRRQTPETNRCQTPEEIRRQTPEANWRQTTEEKRAQFFNKFTYEFKKSAKDDVAPTVKINRINKDI